ncbi:MAG: hypothetical protein MPJ06_02455 [Nitrosopumilus sp.]|nr:hypothetical protein [Nitrosopumilus sp.]MDA7942859.1 hypothetical protein [Nitrosopumilus sp.]MDA7998789.1 hypothetical protein [Nitrosopumilus sp.]
MDGAISGMIMRAASGSDGGAGIREIEHRVYLEYVQTGGDPILGDAAYYLVRDGFSSDVVRRMVGEMEARGDLAERNGLYAPGPPVPERRGAMDDDEAMRRMFSAHPLSKFMIPYRLGFMPELKRYHGRLAGGGTEGDERGLLDSFVAALLEVPHESGFREFRLLFKDFSRAFHVLLGNDPRHDARMPGRLDLAMISHERIWDAFVAAARLHHRNPLHEGLVPGWEAGLRHAMEDLKSATGRFLDSVGDLDGPSRLMGREEREDLLEAIKSNDLTPPIPAWKELESARAL